MGKSWCLMTLKNTNSLNYFNRSLLQRGFNFLDTVSSVSWSISNECCYDAWHHTVQGVLLDCNQGFLYRNTPKKGRKDNNNPVTWLPVFSAAKQWADVLRRLLHEVYKPGLNKNARFSIVLTPVTFMSRGKAAIVTYTHLTQQYSALFESRNNLLTD